MKECPFCGGEIKDNARRCRWCKKWLKNDSEGVVSTEPKIVTPEVSRLSTVGFSINWIGLLIIAAIDFLLSSFGYYLSDTVFGEICSDAGVVMTLMIVCLTLYSTREKTSFPFICGLIGTYVLLFLDYETDSSSNAALVIWLIVLCISAALFIYSLFHSFDKSLRIAGWLFIIVLILFLLFSTVFKDWDIRYLDISEYQWLRAIKKTPIGAIIILVLFVLPANFFPLLFCLPDSVLLYVLSQQIPGGPEEFKTQKQEHSAIYIITIVVLMLTCSFNFGMTQL